MFELTYIHHDCFLLRTPELGIVFDYWFDPACREGDLPAFLKDFPAEMPLYVLVSHFHKDHFNPAVFGWILIHPEIRYIISRDVARHARYMLSPDSRYAGHKVDPSKVTVLTKGEIYSDSLLNVHAFGSTDVGNSYAATIKSQDLKVFHAGDLNCWAWRDESTAEEVRSAENAFRSELRSIANSFPEFDVVMFPVDSRIGTDYAEGARIFADKINVKRFFPMHFTLADDDMLARRKQDALDFSSYASARGEYIGLADPYDSYTDEDPVDHCKADTAREFSDSWFLSAGDANAERELSLPLLTSRLIDIATAHANIIEIGNPSMPNDHCGWVLSRLAIEMTNYPPVDSIYRIDTWVERWNRHFSERDFCICGPTGKPCGYARSIWMVLDTITHANAGLDSLPFREDYLSDRNCPIPRQGKHRAMALPSEITANEKRTIAADEDPATYTFFFSDLDAYRHVDTVKYVMLLLNQYSLREHDEYAVRRIELSFLNEGAYGMTVEILRSDSPAAGEGEDAVTDFLLRDQSTHTPIMYSKVFRRKRPS